MSYPAHLYLAVFRRWNYPKTVAMALSTFLRYFHLSISFVPTHSIPYLNQNRHLSVQQRQTVSLKCFHKQAYSSQVRRHPLGPAQSR